MNPAKIQNPTRVLAEDQDEYEPLSIRDETLDGGFPVMWSDWIPSPEEIEALRLGARIRLGIIGTRHPPVFLGVTAEHVEPDPRPPECRERLREEGKSYMRGNCAVCGWGILQFAGCIYGRIKGS